MQNRMNKYYEFAGVKIRFSGPDFEECEKIAKFRVESCETELDYEVRLQEYIEPVDGEMIHSDKGREYYGEHDQRVWVMKHNTTKEIVMLNRKLSEKAHEVLFLDKYPKAWGEAMVLKIMDLPEQIIHYQGIFIHASFVVWNGQAILFCGRKQIGKSTQANLWCKENNAMIANGDRAILRILNGKWHACGSPYCGTSNICENVNVPVRGIVILEQGTENIVQEAGVREAMISLLKNCSYNTWDREQMETVLNLMGQISRDVPFVKLSCLPDKSAVIALEEYLCQSRI